MPSQIHRLSDSPASGELKQRVDQYMTAGGINLQTLCGPEADAGVANIEAGQ